MEALYSDLHAVFVMITAVSRVISVAPLAPEKLAYALARYSRSADSIHASLDWVLGHDSARFFESFYFQYGHSSIADLGHLALCFEGISEVAAIELEDEQLWDGQARSSRYQDFSRAGFIRPPELDAEQTARYEAAARALLAAYRETHERMVEHLSAKLPRPESMKPDAYQRNIAARAFDVARYLLFLGIPTGVGQVTSIRTLEKQIRRLRASAYQEVRELGAEAAAACAAPPTCGAGGEAMAPTLARYVEADPYPGQARAELAAWAQANLGAPTGRVAETVELTKTAEPLAEIAASLLYAVTDRPFGDLYQEVAGWSRARQAEVLDVALQSRSRRDELLREFRGGPYAFDMLIDVGAYRDLHRHRRCQQSRQAYSWQHGFAVPAAIEAAGLEAAYRGALESARTAAEALPAAAGDYLLPFAARAGGFCSEWTSPRPNTSSSCAAA